MAAAETAPAVGTRRAVIRSERFVQWQRQLSSARRAPYGSRKRSDDKKIGEVQNQQQKESMDGLGSKDSRGKRDGTGEEDDRDASGMSRERVHRRPSMDCKDAEKACPPHVCENGQLILGQCVLCNGQQRPQEQLLGPLRDQPVLVLAHPIMRRGRCSLDGDRELQLPTRGEVEDANVLERKQLMRSLTRAQCTEGPPPPPLKLPKLHVVLSRNEVQEDWIKMTGRRYTGKPRKSALAHLGLELCTSMTCASMIRRYLNGC